MGVAYKDEEQVAPQKSSTLPPPIICFLRKLEDKTNNSVNIKMNLSIDLIQH